MTTIEERHLREEEQQRIFTNKLREERKQQQLNKRRKKRKLLPEDMDYIYLIPDIKLFNLELNDKQLFKAKSYNKEKQEEEYIQFMFFKYEAPISIIKELLGFSKRVEKANYRNGMDLVSLSTPFKDISFFELFQTIATAGSVRKLLKDFLNKKEVHYFLNSKEETIDEAIIEAKIKYSNINNKLSGLLKEKFLERGAVLSNKKEYILTFISNNQDNLDKNKMEELLDFFFLGLAIDIELKNYFSRSFQNIINDCDDWHIEQIFMKKIRKTRWEPIFDNWEYIRGKDDIITIEEIYTAKHLSVEGRAMHHCVGSYAHSCASGNCSILSMKRNGERLVTIEVNKKSKNISQVKGRSNRKPTSMEVNILDRFAVDNTLNISKYIKA